MNKKERNYISERLQVLVGNKVADINRNHGDIWIDFVDEHGKCYILLMQTLFRICDNEKFWLLTQTNIINWNQKVMMIYLSGMLMVQIYLINGLPLTKRFT